MKTNRTNHLISFYKLDGLQETLSKTFAEVYSTCQELSVDEQMVGTKCRVGFIQYMPKKPQKFGIKIWLLCEARSGYCLQFLVCTGKTDNIQEKGLSYRVVIDLLAIFLNKNHHVYFLPPFPYSKTWLRKIHSVVSTIRADRGKILDNFK